MAHRSKLRTLGISCALIAFCLGAIGTGLIHNIVHGNRCVLTPSESMPAGPWDGSTSIEKPKPKSLSNTCMVCTLLSHVQLFTRHPRRVAASLDRPLGCLAQIAIGLLQANSWQPITPRAPPSHACI